MSPHVGENPVPPTPTSTDLPTDDRLVLKWLESHPSESHSSLTHERLHNYLTKAGQPRHVSGNACIKLCFFIEQCMKSKSPQIKDAAYSERSCLGLFNFYIEWNEKNQNRSMRQVMELISTLIAKNPSEAVRLAVKKAIIDRDVMIITHQAAQPLVKPAFKSLESLMSKGTISAQDLLEGFRQNSGIEIESRDPGELSIDTFFSAMFEWMSFADISPAAGKFLVTMFRDLRTSTEQSQRAGPHTASWQRWIRRGLMQNPDALENVKNYLFTPLFKLDRPGSLAFLEDLNKQGSTWELGSEDLGAQSLLQLSAIETGKKAGLVEEPDTVQFQRAPKKVSGSITLNEESIASLLVHESDTVRSLAFSVLVSSSSAIRPLSNVALEAIKANIATLYSDTDAKFRNEVLSSTKHLIERLRGTTSFLVREVDTLKFQTSEPRALSTPVQEQAQKHLSELKTMLLYHESFINHYVDFLLGELVPTASYQRHVTALRALLLLLRSGILLQEPGNGPAQLPGNATVWPFFVDFFTRGSLRLLMDLVMDPFEDVRTGATNILKLASPGCFEIDRPAPQEQAILYHDAKEMSGTAENDPRSSTEDIHEVGPQRQPRGLLQRFIRRVEVVSQQTGRADHADGVARLYGLLYSLQTSADGRLQILANLVVNLEQKISFAEQDVGKAVSGAPIHGTFAALTFVWDSVDHAKDFTTEVARNEDTRKQLDVLQQRIADCCLRIWTAVKDILCNDSPEGHIPLDLDDADVIDTKDVLSYSFRAIHESSNLIRALVNKLKPKTPALDTLPILPTTTFTEIGNLSYEQLSNLRHRGAFSTVSLTFAICCQATQYPTLPASTADLLADWYKGALSCIATQYSTTRRSAGIPALITGILSANSRTVPIDDVVDNLIKEASKPVGGSTRDEQQLPQVHALNSIKDIVKSASIGKQADKFIPALVDLAGDRMMSGNWAIRNSGHLLTRSIIDNIIKSSSDKHDVDSGWDGKSVRIAYEQFPTLGDTIVKLLDAGHQATTSGAQHASSTEATFPALDIIRRAGPPVIRKAEIEGQVFRLLGNTEWHIREQAAEAYCSLTMSISWTEIVLYLLKESVIDSNHRHGLLKAVKAVLIRRLPLEGQEAESRIIYLLPILHEHWTYDSKTSCDPYTLAVHAEIYNVVALFIIEVPHGSRALREAIVPLLSQDLQDSTLVKQKENPTLYSILWRALACNGILQLALKNDSASLTAYFHYCQQLGVDAMVEALQLIPRATKNLQGPNVLKHFCEAYLMVISTCNTLAVQIAAIQGLCDCLEARLQAPYNDASQMECIDLVVGLQLHQDSIMSPTLTNAWTSMGAWRTVLTIFQMQARLCATNGAVLDDPKVVGLLKSFSVLCIRMGTADQDYDTRHATASALCSFLRHLVTSWGSLPGSDHLLPTMFALYDILNDDDQEIRDLAASTVSTIIGKQMVPLAASQALADYLLQHHKHSPAFVRYISCRMIGNPTDTLDQGTGVLYLHPVREAFALASVTDNALFAEEKQNLYVDESRDVLLWCQIFNQIPQSTFESNKERALHADISAILMWVAQSARLLKGAVAEDAAAGWTSDPRVFRILSTTIMATNYFLDYFHELLTSSIFELETGLEQKLAEAVADLEVFVQAAVDSRVHPTLLQSALQRRSLSEETRLRNSAHASLVCPLQPRRTSVHPTPIKQLNATPSSSRSETLADIDLHSAPTATTV